MNGYDLLKSMSGVDPQFLQEMEEWQDKNEPLAVQDGSDATENADDTHETAVPWQHNEISVSDIPKATPQHTPNRLWTVFQRIAVISASAACLVLTLGIIQRAVFSHRNVPIDESSAVTDVTDVNVQTETSAVTQTTGTTTETTASTTVTTFTTTPATSDTTIPLNTNEESALVTKIPQITETTATTGCQTETQVTTGEKHTTIFTTTTSTTSFFTTASIVETQPTMSQTENTTTTQKAELTYQLEIQQLPNKLEYHLGESLDLEGGVLYYSCVNGVHQALELEEVPMTSDDVTVNASLFEQKMMLGLTGEVKVFVTYRGLTASFGVTILE